MTIKRQKRLWYLLEFVGAFSIYDAVSIVLLLGRGFTLLDFGIAEGCFHIVSLICEVPSGMLADIFGRKRIIVLGHFFFFAAAMAMLFSKTLIGVILSYAFTALGYNMASGTKEALFYDSLSEHGVEDTYLKVNSTAQIFLNAALIIGSLCSGLALNLGYEVCYAIRAGTCFVTMLLACFLTEPEISKSRMKKLSLKEFGHTLKTHFIESFRFLKNSQRSTKIMLVSGVIGCAKTLILFYIQEHLSANGASGFIIGLATIAFSFGSIIGARLARTFEKRLTLTRTAVSTFVLAAVGICIGSIASSLAAIIIGGFLLCAFEMILYLNTDAALNRMFAPETRATLISVNSMVFSIFMLPASPLSGAIAERWSLSTAFLCFAGVLTLCAGIISVVHARKNKPKKRPHLP